MKTISITVNNEELSADVAPRTQLAELLRDELHLTGTHLGCEQGVCGACTVVVDGQPIRSCLTYAHSVSGCEVMTVEGLNNDSIGQALRDAFTQHHALQCGFCTPGMLITARDILLRHESLDESTVRHELSGNLCRCTGYMGIVGAVMDVAEQLGKAGGESDLAHLQRETPGPGAFVPFEITQPQRSESTQGNAAVVAEDQSGWTTFRRRLGIDASATAVWQLFESLPDVAACIPGVAITTEEGGAFEGTASIRFGPISASFDGRGERQLDSDARSGQITAHGQSDNGQTLLDVQFDYAIVETPADVSTATPVEVGIRFRIRGALAQYNRPDLVESFTDVMLQQFTRNCERRLRGDEVLATAPIGGFGLAWDLLKRFLARTFGR
jgi:aerobic carbon-monoxide dehydrogenase small subunit